MMYLFSCMCSPPGYCNMLDLRDSIKKKNIICTRNDLVPPSGDL